MILTICPNPSIDCTIELDNLNVGKLNRIRNKMESYSGKALNVAIGVARLQGDALATGLLAEKQSKLFEHALDTEGVRHNFVYCSGDTRVNYKIIDNKSMLTEINDKGESVASDKQIELIELVKRESKNCEMAVMSGSLPKGVEPSFYDEVLSVIPKNVKIIADAEKENLEQAMKGKELFMVKPNLREFEQFIGREVKSKADIVKASKVFLDNGVRNVLVSLGEDGAILTDGTDSFYCKSASVAVNSAAGAGDSMVSAVCMGVINGESKAEILRMGVAAGTASITTPGTSLFYKDKYQEIYSKIFVEKL